MGHGPAPAPPDRPVSWFTGCTTADITPSGAVRADASPYDGVQLAHARGERAPVGQFSIAGRSRTSPGRARYAPSRARAVCSGRLQTHQARARSVPSRALRSDSAVGNYGPQVLPGLQRGAGVAEGPVHADRLQVHGDRAEGEQAARQRRRAQRGAQVCGPGAASTPGRPGWRFRLSSHRRKGRRPGVPRRRGAGRRGAWCGPWRARRRS